MKSAAAAIPSVDRLLNQPALGILLESHGRSQVTSALRAHLDELRKASLEGSLNPASLGDDRVAAALAAKLGAAAQPRLRPVFNLTGTVLHTNLGRALLPDEAVQAVIQAMRSPVNLEYDLDTGGRGDRD